MGNIVNTVRMFSRNNADAGSFRRYSSLSNGTPSTYGLDKCTCDKDSSVTGKTANAINTAASGCKSVCKEVDNETMGLTTCSSSRSGCLTLSMAHTEPSGVEEANKSQGKPNETILTDATVSPKENYSTDSMVAEGLISSPARDTHKYKELKLHSVSPGRSLFYRDAYVKLIDGDLNVGLEGIPEVSGNCEMVAFQDRAVCGPLDVRGSECNPNASLKRGAKRKRSSHKAAAKMMTTENLGTLASLDVKYSEMVRSPLTRSKAMALSVSTPEYHSLRSTRMGHLVVPPSDSGSQNIISDVAKPPIISFVEQSSADKELQLTPLPLVRSSLTPSKAKVLSVPTLKTLQLRSSRSGRLIVPHLDPGTQSIIYNTDGSICGVTNSELQRPRGFESERPAKRRRKPQCPTPYRGKSLQFDGEL